MKHTDIKTIFDNPSDFIGKSVTVCGWVRTSRESKTIAFLEVNDGTTLKHIQIIIDKNTLEGYEAVMPLCSAVSVLGVCVRSENNQIGRASCRERV